MKKMNGSKLGDEVFRSYSSNHHDSCTFADEDETADQKLLWENQIKILRQETGG